MIINTPCGEGWLLATIKASSKDEATKRTKAYLLRYPYDKYHTERIEWFERPDGSVTVSFCRMTSPAI